MLGATLLGFYLLAFNVSSWVPGLVGTAVRYVSIPSFSRLAEQTHETLALGVRRAIPLMLTVVMPIAVTMAVLGPAMIHFLYGAKWVPAGDALRFLAVVMIARMLSALAFDILTSLGKTHATLWLNLGWAAVLIPVAHRGGTPRWHPGCRYRARDRGRRGRHPINRDRAATRRRRPTSGGACTGSSPPWRLVAGLMMLGLSELLAFPRTVELFVAGGAGLLAYVLVVVPPSQVTMIMAECVSFGSQGAPA